MSKREREGGGGIDKEERIKRGKKEQRGRWKEEKGGEEGVFEKENK